jgi:ABC-type sulfate transport system permease subunit
VIFATVVDWEALFDVIAASLVGGIGVTVVFSLAIYGSTRFTEMQREHRPLEAAGYAALAVAGLLVTAAVVGFGLYEMLAK